MTALASRELTVMEGAGNSFAVLDERAPLLDECIYRELAVQACAAFDVDGLLVVGLAPGCDGTMRIFNRDGSEAEMCGNGIRCVVRFLDERGTPDPKIIQTKAGPVQTAVLSRDPFVVRADLGRVTFPFGPEPQLLAGAPRIEFIGLSVGNPHAVVFVEQVDGLDLESLAARFAADARYPQGVNVHVAERLDETALRVRHHERGAGETRACGSGAVACAAAAIATRGVHSPVTVLVPGGMLAVRFGEDGSAILEGPARSLGTRALGM